MWIADKEDRRTHLPPARTYFRVLAIGSNRIGECIFAWRRAIEGTAAYYCDCLAAALHELPMSRDIIDHCKMQPKQNEIAERGFDPRTFGL